MKKKIWSQNCKKKPKKTTLDHKIMKKHKKEERKI